MKILMIGDIFAANGRKVVKMCLPKLIKKYRIDFVIANGENTSHGKSIIKKHYDELKKIGINIITSGNHIFQNSEIFNYIDKVDDLLKPLNMNPYTIGQGTVIKIIKNKKIRVTNLIGRHFMIPCDNPYIFLDKILEKDDSDIHIIDYHGESSAEKLAFAWHYDGRITCLFGTHTHVQTVDNRILPKKTAYITDLGMCGSYNSIIGANPDEVIWKEKTGLPVKFVPSLDDTQLLFSGAILTISNKTNNSTNLKRLFLIINKN